MAARMTNISQRYFLLKRCSCTKKTKQMCFRSRKRVTIQKEKPRAFEKSRAREKCGMFVFVRKLDSLP